MKDMLAELNHMLEQRAGAARSPTSSEFMERYGDFFPENPQNLDELLEVMAQRMAAMQAMLNSMTPEQRAQLQGLAEQLLEDMDLRWQMDQLGREPAVSCSRRWAGTASTTSAARTRSASPRRRQLMNELGDIDQLENLLRGATNPGALAEVDIDRARELLGDDAARSLERLAELAKMLEEAGLIEQQGGPLRAHARAASARSARTPSTICSRSWPATRWASTRSSARGVGHERAYETKPYEFGDPFNLHIERTVRNAVQRHRRRHAGAPHARRLRGRAHRAPGPVEHRAHARPVAVDADARQLPRRQEGGDGAALADLDAVPARLPRHRRLQRGGPGDQARATLPEVSWDFVYGTNMQHGFLLTRQMLARQTRHQADHHDHRRRADRPHRPRHGEPCLPLPADAGDDRRHARRGDALHPRGHPHQHVHARRHAATCSTSSRSSRR